MVQENGPAFERIMKIEVPARRRGSSGDPREVDYADIQGSGEKFTRDALLDAGIASRTTGTQ